MVQRYRRRADAEQRLRVMRALSEPAAAAGIPIPRVREADLEADPPWVIFAALPGVPVPEAGEFGLDGPRFPETALDGRAAGPVPIAADRAPRTRRPVGPIPPAWPLAAHCADEVRLLDAAERTALTGVLDRVPVLFAGRPALLAHGDFAPGNVLIDAGTVTGLVDFESVRPR